MPRLHTVLRNLADPRPVDEPSPPQEQPAPPEPKRKQKTRAASAASERAMAAMGGAVKLDASAPIINDTIPDGEAVPFAVTKEGSAACCRQLLGDLKAIEDHPNQRQLQENLSSVAMLCSSG